MNATPAKRPVNRIPRVPTSNDTAPRGSGCLLPLVLLVLSLAIALFFLRDKPFLRDLLDKLRPHRYEDVQIIDPSRGYVEPEPEKKPAATNVVETPPPPPPEPPKKTMAELKAEADAAQRVLALEIEKARKGVEPLPSFDGIPFGEVVKGPAVSMEHLPAHEGETNACGLCYRMAAPARKTEFGNLGKQATVFVTPKTRRVFRIEFAKNIAREQGWTLNAETTGLVSRIAGELKAKPFALDLTEYPLGRREFVFPVGETTLVVGEYGGEQLKLSVEHAGLRAAALEEAEVFHQETLAQNALTKALASDKYPNGGMVKFVGVRQKGGTPRAFCGVVFGSLPPYSARVGVPASSTDARSFFIDYRKARCKPFMNFEHGRAELSEINGAVVGVRLFSNGPEDGLTAAEYYGKVREAIERKFKTQPAETKGEGAMPEVTYAVGSLTLRFGPDANGGFSLSAENVAMKAVW